MISTISGMSMMTMSRRLMATLENQRVLLASIAHDLRTPITSLMIKSEFIADAELKERMRLSLEELQTTTEAALEAAQTGMGEEKPREVDVAALVESMCADLVDLGGDVTFVESGTVKAMCRPNEIRRAARNLVENALRYGKCARVALRAGGGQIAITVDDDQGSRGQCVRTDRHRSTPKDRSVSRCLRKILFRKGTPAPVGECRDREH